MKKANIQNGVDYISTLPDPILHLILSRLHSTIEVVRTSVLSTRWKYLWTSIPSLDIDNVRTPNDLFERGELKEFVYWVLLNRTLDLNSFKFDCTYYHYEMSTIRRWIHAVVMRKVKKIDLTFSLMSFMNTYEGIVLPRCLVDCGSLEMLTLKLSLHSLSLKSFTGSKTLKVLRLDSVELLDHDLVQSFFLNCPLLEELSLINCLTHNLDYFSISCPNLKTLRTDNRGLDYYYSTRYLPHEKNILCEWLTVICPKLVYFQYGGHMANHFLFDVKSLKKAVIELEDIKLTFKGDFGVTICELFAQVSYVEYLSINLFFHRSISFKREFCDRAKEGFPESLPNLKKLEIKFDCDLMIVLLRILRCSSNLESLHLIIHENISSREVKIFFEELEEVETRRTLTCHLKRVEFSGFKGEKDTLAIAQFLLEHGNALEEMVFSFNREKYRKQSMEDMNTLSNFYKASSSVKNISSREVKIFFEELEEVETRRTLTRHLKRVEFSGCKGEKKTLAIARFLLKHGNALEEMVFSLKREIYRKQSMEDINTLSNFYKASSTVKHTDNQVVLVLGRSRDYGTQSQVDRLVGSSCYNIWLARSKSRVGPCCLSEGSAYLVPRVEGNALGWFHRAANTSRS
ncbi:F-box domain, FBD domain, Leucine-rich repeat domain, L domain-like protein [Artemisia annua]|uniref:F-box domain, FBD domain, Leucine-rich repeat domain, L domain-like protein n=1 Tax=Artemisia annua TaxID=35608 RepID=A0A2U1NLF8_ARTAN|nr:F-box domain, FBD domain, Leucine-rich repeat domain, L domain-like protein [Artemisia annua]